MNAPTELRLPPHSVEAEQSVIGGLLLDNAAWERIAGLVSEADFYRDEHRRIFRHIVTMLDRGQPADAVTVAESLDRSGEGAVTGGLAYLGELAANTPCAANVRHSVELHRNLTRGGCGQNLGLLGGSPCIHTTSAYGRWSCTLSSGSAAGRPFANWVTRRRIHSRSGITAVRLNEGANR